MTPHVAAIVNPRSGNGRTGRAWRLIAAALTRELGPIKAHFTLSPATADYLPASELTRMALRQGAQMVIAVGGDGTLNEVLNGFFENGVPVNPHAHLAILPAGTGSDFRRSLDLNDDIEKNATHIGSGNTRKVDIGQIRFTGPDGVERHRYFLNIASFGLTAEAVRRVNRSPWTKSLGPSFAFLSAGIRAVLSQRRFAMRLTTDTGFDEIVEMGAAAICNGRYFGNGMLVAPDAAPDDGWLDVVILREAGLRSLLQLAPQLYRGRPLEAGCITRFRARSLTATPLDKTLVPLELDGETPGRMPARFDIQPGAITLRC